MIMAKDFPERKEAFKPIYAFLCANGITDKMNKTEIISNICNKFKPDFAQKILDLWFAIDPNNKMNVYYNQDLAFNVDCEDLIEKIDAKNEIYLSLHDNPLQYKEKIDTKKILITGVKKSKKFLALKSLIYTVIVLLIIHMSQSYYQSSIENKNIKLASIISIIVLSILLLTRIVNIIEKWLRIYKFGFKNYFYLIFFILFVVYIFILLSDTLDSIIYFYVLIVTIAIVTISTIFLISDIGYKCLSWCVNAMLVLIGLIVTILKYAVPLLFFILIIKSCITDRSLKEKYTVEPIKIQKEKIEKTSKQNVQVSIEKKVYKSKVMGVDDNIKSSHKLKNMNKNFEKKVPSCTYYYTTSNVRIRRNASRNSAILGTIKKSTKVCIVKNLNSWKYVQNKGWIYGKFLISVSKYKRKKKIVKSYIDKSVWHCEAKSKRASGWVERVGKKNAMNGALYQCQIRRQTSSKCKIIHCYKL